MNPTLDLAVISITAIFMLVAGMVGGILPQFVKLSDRGLHRFLALGTGMLLGTIFYHMLPEALHSFGATTFVLIGLLGVFVVERILVAESVSRSDDDHAGHHHHDHHHDEDHNHEAPLEVRDRSSHSIIGVTALAGLSVHALMVGLGLSAQLGDSRAVVPLMTSLLVHKLSEAFSLSTIFLLAGYPKGKSLMLLGIFALIEPFGMVLGAVALGVLPHGWESGVAGLAAGTFLYVALCDLLPEVFHRREGRWGSLLMLVIGLIGIAFMISGGHSH